MERTRALLRMSDKGRQHYFAGVGVELALSAWLSVSLLLFGNALLLYHMVRKSSFEMTERTAAVLTISLIAGAAALLVAGAIGYMMRTHTLRKLQGPVRRRDEDVTSACVCAAVLALLLVLGAVGYVLVKGSLRSATQDSEPHA